MRVGKELGILGSSVLKNFCGCRLGEVPRGQAANLGPHPLGSSRSRRTEFHSEPEGVRNPAALIPQPQPTETRRPPLIVTHAAGVVARLRHLTKSQAVANVIPSEAAALVTVSPSATRRRNSRTVSSGQRQRGESSPTGRPAALTAIVFRIRSPFCAEGNAKKLGESNAFK